MTMQQLLAQLKDFTKAVCHYCLKSIGMLWWITDSQLSCAPPAQVDTWHHACSFAHACGQH
jgi:hypothetical protein